MTKTTGATTMAMAKAADFLEELLLNPDNATDFDVGTMAAATRTARDFRSRLLLSRAHAMGRFSPANHDLAYAYVLAAWASGPPNYDLTYELAEEQRFWEKTLSKARRNRAESLVWELLDEGEKSAHRVGEPFNGSWYGWYDDTVPVRVDSAEFAIQYALWLNARKIKPRAPSKRK
jgi:hypothetical protein